MVYSSDSDLFEFEDSRMQVWAVLTKFKVGNPVVLLDNYYEW